MPSKQGARLHVQISNAGSTKFQLSSLTAQHPFIHAMQILLPQLNSSDTAAYHRTWQRSMTVIQAALPAACSWTIHSVCLGSLVQQLVSSGMTSSATTTFQAVSLSCDTSDGAFVITPSWQLCLVVSPAVYQRLGLIGRSMPNAAGE